MKRYSTEVKADRVVLLGSRDDTERHEEAQASDAPTAEASATGTNFDDDIPFVWLVPFIVPALAASLLMC